MIKHDRSILIAVFIFILLPYAHGKYKTPLPINYPSEIISSGQPRIIWQDIYNERDMNNDIRYSITVKSSDRTFEPVLFYPDIYYKHFFTFQYPVNLKDGKYSYKIERLINNKPINSRNFHFSKYPVTDEFTIDHNNINDIDRLPPEYLIKFLFIERQNRYINKYNSIFFAAGGAATLGIGILFLKVFNFGIISTAAAAICFTNTAVGFSASGYYGYQYVKNNSELKKIIDIGKNISINGGAARGKIDTGVELSF